MDLYPAWIQRLGLETDARGCCGGCGHQYGTGKCPPVSESAGIRTSERRLGVFRHQRWQRARAPARRRGFTDRCVSGKRLWMELVRRNVPGATVVVGRLGIERRRQLLKDSRARLLIDATHPYSLEISHQLIELSRELDLDYFRYERPDSHADAPTQQYDSVEAAAQ